MNHSISQPIEGHIPALRRHGVLDTPRDPSLDRIVALAASLCEAPMSALNLIDDRRHWTTAAVGFEPPEMPSVASICTYVIRQAGVLVVPDLAEDPRFSGSPWAVGEPFLRFYAGAPLETSDGQRIGTLCILGNQPRHITDTQQLILQSLARHAATELELRATAAAARAARLEVERLLSEKEELQVRNDLLKREVDHRVKNSLQVVASMLGMQARSIPDAAAARALEDAQRRIGGIAAVHEQLYRSSDTDVIKAGDFLTGLCAALAASRPDSVDALHLTADEVILSPRRAMKVGLLVTELVANAFKHAYPRGTHGDVRVALIADDRSVRLVVSDDGVGLPAGFGIDGGQGLGMRLIRSVLGQFGGVMSVTPGSGATFVIEMPRRSSAM
ncbi:histidine kinase dimerization/phosphoacceptor domain -containing protein [Xanthobacter autotrophicus]|uniref:histidine kinase dimerization/phosphoacceptor domain -containing protein n=1 Tax=Xanthobacter autotrophicus TaxID=280 RepID=UPI00372A7C9F